MIDYVHQITPMSSSRELKPVCNCLQRTTYIIFEIISSWLKVERHKVIEIL